MNEEQLKTIDSYNAKANEFYNTIGKLPNYNHTYDFLIKNLSVGDEVLDLACGPAQISKYIDSKININITGVDLSEKMLDIARKEIPKGCFYKRSITNFSNNKKYKLVIIGFGIPYLNSEQVKECISNAINNMLDSSYLYISFMHGNGNRVEKTSFGGEHDFLIYYHNKDEIKEIVSNNAMEIIKEYELDYSEKDGSISKDIILIARKIVG